MIFTFGTRKCCTNLHVTMKSWMTRALNRSRSSMTTTTGCFGCAASSALCLDVRRFLLGDTGATCDRNQWGLFTWTMKHHGHSFSMLAENACQGSDSGRETSGSKSQPTIAGFIISTDKNKKCTLKRELSAEWTQCVEMSLQGVIQIVKVITAFQRHTRTRLNIWTLTDVISSYQLARSDIVGLHFLRPWAWGWTTKPNTQ